MHTVDIAKYNLLFPYTCFYLPWEFLFEIHFALKTISIITIDGNNKHCIMSSSLLYYTED
jgi:hypothetical protein